MFPTWWRMCRRTCRITGWDHGETQGFGLSFLLSSSAINVATLDLAPIVEDSVDPSRMRYCFLQGLCSIVSISYNRVLGLIGSVRIPAAFCGNQQRILMVYSPIQNIMVDALLMGIQGQIVDAVIVPVAPHAAIVPGKYYHLSETLIPSLD